MEDFSTTQNSESSTVVNILLIDDNPTDREFYRILLSERDGQFNVYEADNTQIAIDIFKNENIDCILLDFYMPEANGIELIDDLKDTLDIAPGLHLPIIILTGNPDENVLVEATNKGILSYLMKDSVKTAEQLETEIFRTINWVKKLNKDNS